MAIRTRNAFRPVIDQAVREALAAVRDAGGTVGRPSLGLPARTVTRRGTDPQGRAITLYPFMTELDSTQSNAVTS